MTSILSAEARKQVTEAFASALTMWKRTDMPRKLDDALTWVQNDQLATARVEAALALLASLPEATLVQREVSDARRLDGVPCWLVEKRKGGRTVGYLGYALGTFEWFPTPDQATRFVRREDANGIAECFEFEDVILAEHIWG